MSAITLLYIDPGTGSMLFTILIGIIATLVFFLQKLWLKLKFVISGGKASATAMERIPYVIFSDSRRYWNVFKPICDEFEKRGIKLEYWTASPDDPALEEKYEHIKCVFIGEGNKAFAKLNLMNADICLSTTPGLDVLQWKRSPNVKWYMHTFHSLDDTLSYKMFGLDYYDEILLVGDFQKKYVRMLEEKRGIPSKQLTVAGCTYMDSLDQKVKSAGQGGSNSGGRLKVLLAPSWGESAILYRFGDDIISSLLATGNCIIIRPHPQSVTAEAKLLKALQEKYPNSDTLEWNFDNDNFEVLKRSDIMITDYSSVIYDFALIFNKPIFYADTDWDPAPYDAAWSDLPVWRYEVLPKLGLELKKEDFPKLKEKIQELVCSGSFQAGREEVRKVYWEHIGESSRVIVDRMLDKEKEICI